MQGPGSGGLFALLAGVFRSLSGAVLGPVSLLVTTCAGVLLSAFRGGYLQRRFWSVMLCVWAGIFLHQRAAVCPGSVSGKYICRALAWRLGRRTWGPDWPLRPISPGVGPGENRR
ncbi:MAG: hypothetical protein ACLU9S_14220 [Oscillospiraceae bacterium]